MELNIQIGVIIATSFNRTELLFNRSLKSVLNQTLQPDFIVIVDDNINEGEFNTISESIKEFDFEYIYCIRNHRTRHCSGTGAWNSGLEFLQTKFSTTNACYIAILDDDDEWERMYLEKCYNQIKIRGIYNTTAIFAGLIRIHKDKNVECDLRLENLTVENFLVGNPGIQGSNMFFLFQTILDIGGFDETLKSCTDRDLVIRFLLQKELSDNIAVIKETLVIHHAENCNTVTNDYTNKWTGLDTFYYKYMNLFTEKVLKLSLKRAESLFKYPNTDVIMKNFDTRRKLVLSMPLHNGANTIRQAVLSVKKQINICHQLILVIGDDHSTDNWYQQIADLMNENIITINIKNGGSSYKVRNEINNYILQNIENVDYIGRLDADDELADEYVISKLENVIRKNDPDVILAGNYQRKNDEIVGTNIPSEKLFDNRYLLDCLHKMSLGFFEAELPSCNIFVKPEHIINYPQKESAEDHWFVVEFFKLKNKLNICVTDILYCIYSLDGLSTKNNKMDNLYLQSRIELYRSYRQFNALNSLLSYQSGDYNYIGEGSEGVVFTDGKKVYKIFDCANDDTMLFVKTILPKFKKTIHLYSVENVIDLPNGYILIYPYEKGEPVRDKLNQREMISFLVEMWQKKIIFRNIKPDNFIRVNGVLKLIDYELESYTDNLFLNMSVRAFLYIKYHDRDNDFINKLCRSAINNFNLPELEGIQRFVNTVFSNIIFNESKSVFTTLENTGIKNIHLDSQNWFGYTEEKPKDIIVKSFREKVSLIVKTCPQDYETIYANVKHIIRQLSTPNTFYEKIIAIDPVEKGFLRQYTDKGTLEKLMCQINRLLDESIVDRCIVCPEDEIANVNERWFGVPTIETHSGGGAPITPQLYAFEQAEGKYIFQMDSDVIVVRKDFMHSYLEDMVSEMEKNEKVVSVGFNICQETDYKPYFGFENGGFVPEVRMGLFHKQRLFSLRPLPNKMDKSGKFELSWFRSLHEKQRQTGFCSIRGGDSRSFFIHPQNYRKTNADIWTTILDRAENGYIPDCQINEFDCAGSYYDWTIPKRQEKLVIICLVRNIENARFLKMFCSVISQTYKDWGMVLIDDASDNGLPDFIDELINPFRHKITFIKNRVWQGGTANIYKAIHYFVSNIQAVIMTIDGDDAIIGNTVFETIMNKFEYENADVVIGGMYQTYRLQPHYRYPVDFVNPRQYDSAVWQHIRSFRKYLFDSLDISDMKLNDNRDDTMQKVNSMQWLPDCTDYAIMIPVIEMSSNPMQIHQFVYYHEREATSPEKKHDKEICIRNIINKESKCCNHKFDTRKSFLPNFSKIEIDITYDCNLKCVSCNRSCAQLPTKEKMEVYDIQTFIQESIALNKKWKLINILGGEPTLHPDFQDIIKYISEDYIAKFSPDTILQIVSNGLTAKSRDLLELVKQYKNVVIDYNSFKTDIKIEYFTPFNDAPIDDENYKNVDYSKACWVTSYCGIGLNKYGYYGCSVCGGIDRVINKNRGGIKHMKDITMEKIKQQFIKFCGLCGNFKGYANNGGDFIPRCEKAPFNKNVVSKTWQILYNNNNR